MLEQDLEDDHRHSEEACGCGHSRKALAPEAGCLAGGMPVDDEQDHGDDEGDSSRADCRRSQEAGAEKGDQR